MLHGRVNPNGQVTSWWFEYGPTTAYGSRTPAASLSSGTSLVPVSAPVGNLANRTTYHYRVVATWSNGAVTRGGDLTFRTRKR